MIGLAGVGRFYHCTANQGRFSKRWSSLVFNNVTHECFFHYGSPPADIYVLDYRSRLFHTQALFTDSRYIDDQRYDELCQCARDRQLLFTEIKDGFMDRGCQIFFSISSAFPDYSYFP